MNRRAIAVRLSLIVAVAGLLPIAAVGLIGLQLLSQRTERATQAALQAIAEQTAARIDGYIAHQKELVRAIAAVTPASGRESELAQVVLDAPSLGRVRIVGTDTAMVELPRSLDASAMRSVLAGAEVASPVFLAGDTTPAMELCTPMRATSGHALCAELDLLELWRFVQRIHVAPSGYALAFDRNGHLMASGLGRLRSAILTGDPVPESAWAALAAQDPTRAPTSYTGPDGTAVLAAWAPLPGLGWTVVVEEPLSDVLHSARQARWALWSVLALALLLSLAVGLFQSQRLLGALEVEERWKTAGRIATGITHDLGHRLRVLQQTAGLAEAGDPAFLPRIRENLKAEVETLKKFVVDFADLSRDVRSLELFPLELGAFLESLKRTATPHAEGAGVTLEVRPPPGPAWVRADRHLLERAVLNLVSNAVEAAPRGSAVELAVAEQDDACGLAVRDHGPGIAPERLGTLFNAFVSTKRTGAHVGMGLPNVKRIIDAHGGRVEAESAPGSGTVFRVWLARSPPPGP